MRLYYAAALGHLGQTSDDIDQSVKCAFANAGGIVNTAVEVLRVTLAISPSKKAPAPPLTGKGLD